MARKSRSKQRGKGVGSRSQSAGRSRGGSRSSAGSAGGSRSGGNRSGSGARGNRGRSTSSKSTGSSKSTSSKSKSTTTKKDSKITQRNIQRFGEQHVRNLQQKQRDFKSVQNKTMSRSDFASKHYGKGYGNTGNVGRSLQSRPETQRELDRIAANIAAQEAAKKEATRKSMFSSDRLTNPDAFNTSKLASNISASFTNPAVQNFGQNFGNWYNLGKNQRIANEATARYGKIGDLFARDTSKVDPRTLFGDDRLQRGMSNRAFKEGKQSKFFGRPDRAFGIDLSESWKQKKLVKVPAVEGGPMSGPTPLIRRLVTDIGKFALSPKAALLAYNFRVDPLADGTLKGKPGFETEAGGLNIGKTPSETEGGRNIRSLNQVTNIGEKRDEATDARTNSLLNTAFNIGSKIPFVGPQLQNLKSDIKPYTDRITVETPKNTKKVISEFVGNMDSMTDTTRRFVNEFATDNPNIPNRFGLETAADVVQTLNPMNKNYAPQLSTSWGKPLQAIANNFVSGGTKNIFQEAALNTGAEGTISPAEGLSIAKQVSKNIQTPGTLGNFEATKLKNLADQYGGGTIKPTPGTIFRGITGNRGGTRNQTSRSGTGTGTDTGSMASTVTTPEEFIIPEIPQQELSDLQNLQQQAYNQQMSAYGVPNYTAQIQPTQNVRPLRRRQYFNRDYFTQFV